MLMVLAVVTRCAFGRPPTGLGNFVVPGFGGALVRGEKIFYIKSSYISTDELYILYISMKLFTC